MSPDEIRGQSVVEVTKTVLSISSRDDSCIDAKMGCISPKELCKTCGKQMNECNGHFGHIELGAHMFHPFFINELFRTVKFSCPLCCAYYSSKQRDCARCNAIMGTWSRKLRRRDRFGVKDKFEYTYTERQTGRTIVLKPTTSVLHKILKHIGRQDLLLSVLPVAPLCVRPTISMQNSPSKFTFDPLTQSYVSVVREACMLKTFLKYHQAQHIVKSQWRRTQDAVYQIYDTSRLADNKGQALQGLRQRLDGKQGRFRKNLLGTSRAFSFRLFFFFFFFFSPLFSFLHREAGGLLRPDGHHGRPLSGPRPNRCAEINCHAVDEICDGDSLQHLDSPREDTHRAERAGGCALRYQCEPQGGV